LKKKNPRVKKKKKRPLPQKTFPTLTWRGTNPQNLGKKKKKKPLSQRRRQKPFKKGKKRGKLGEKTLGEILGVGPNFCFGKKGGPQLERVHPRHLSPPSPKNKGGPKNLLGEFGLGCPGQKPSPPPQQPLG